MLKMPILVILILSSTILLIDGFPAISNLPLHERMNPSMLRQIFNVEAYENVPEYEVVQLRTRFKRSVDSNDKVKEFRLSAFGKAIHLHLKRNEDFEEQLKTMKVYTAQSTDNGIQYREEIIEDDEPGTTYQDLTNMAAVTIRHGEEGKIQMEGVIGDNLVVKPVPADIWSFDDEFSFDVEQERSNLSVYHANSSRPEEFFSTTSNSCPHLVYESQISSNESYTNFLPRNDALNNLTTSSADGQRSKRSAFPSQAWPEVLLLVDYDAFAVHGFSTRAARRYYVSFLNAVNLRFKAVTNPKINLILSGIVVAESRAASPYLEYNRVSGPGRDLFDGDRAVDDLADYLYAASLEGLPEYDLAVVLTKMDMCLMGGGKYDSSTRGYAYLAGACSVFHGLRRVHKIGIVEDKGGFDGIITAAHEIGHLLGAVHDGSSGSDGRPGANRCSFDDGFIMSYRRDTERSFKWSRCSIQQFRHFLNSENAACLFNKPNHNILEGSELPGTVLTLNAQCKRRFGTNACSDNPEMCTQLHCHRNNDHCWVSLGAAEGSHCGNKRICKNGRCVSGKVVRVPNAHSSRRIPIHTAPTPKATVKSRVCEDNDDALGDGFTCNQLFQTYGSRICKTRIIDEYCCRSRRTFCSRN